jgi:hypothetical protein
MRGVSSSCASLVKQVTGEDPTLFISLDHSPWLTPVAWTPQLTENIQWYFSGHSWHFARNCTIEAVERMLLLLTFVCSVLKNREKSARKAEHVVGRVNVDKRLARRYPSPKHSRAFRPTSPVGESSSSYLTRIRPKSVKSIQ